jgi:hypothetical protein
MTLQNSITASEDRATVQKAESVSSTQEGWIQPSPDARMAHSQFEIIDNVYAAVYVEPLPLLTELYPHIEDEIWAMAHDPNVQRDMRAIALEFDSADADGLLQLL